MKRIKIDYGIDLGTTNSAICRMKNGEAVIKKSEAYGMDTTPSCVHFNVKRTIQVGQKALNLLDRERKIAFVKNDISLINAFQEFKRTMGTDEVYDSKNMGKAYSSEELSSEVLKALKSYVREEEVNAAVITVPAKFQGYQNDATKKAAELAGFKQSILLPEPIAASIAYGLDAKSMDGKWLVFDFGGGTFDAALMKASEGIMKVVDTTGDNRLGGKNLDLAIVDSIIIPYLKDNFSISDIMNDDGRRKLLRNALKSLAEEIKIKLSPADNLECNIMLDDPLGEDDEGNEILIDLTVKKTDYEVVVKPIFQRAIDLSIDLLKNNNLAGKDLNIVLLIGGPTFSETLRNMIREQITDKIDVSIDPMIAVAQGAALFASTQELLEDLRDVDKSNIQLKLIYQSNTVETEEKVGITVLRDKTEGNIPETFFTEIKRNDKSWSSGKIELKGDAEIIDIILQPGKSNGFEIVLFDHKGTEYPGEPNSFSIIQGFKTPGATLPECICIDVFDRSKGKQLLTDIKGLSKNQPLPAKGKIELKTPKDIRPGNSSDYFTIPIYETNSVGTNSIYSFVGLRGNVKITGDNLPGMLPKNSDVELLIKIDQNRDITVSASFPYLDDFELEETIEKNVRKMPGQDELEFKLKNAKDKLVDLESDNSEVNQARINEQKKDLDDLEDSLKKGGSEADTREEIFGRLNGVMIDLDKLDEESEWPNVMQELNDDLNHFKDSNEQFGDEKTENIFKELQEKINEVIKKKNINMAKDLSAQIRQISFALVEKSVGVALDINIIKGFEDNFEMHEWKNRSQARQLINEAKTIISTNRATKDTLRPIVSQLYDLLPGPKDSIKNDGTVLEQ